MVQGTELEHYVAVVPHELPSVGGQKALSPVELIPHCVQLLSKSPSVGIPD